MQEYFNEHACYVYTYVARLVATFRHPLYIYIYTHTHTHRGADKSLARLERKQAPATEDFDVHVSYL